MAALIVALVLVGAAGWVESRRRARLLSQPRCPWLFNPRAPRRTR